MPAPVDPIDELFQALDNAWRSFASVLPELGENGALHEVQQQAERLYNSVTQGGSLNTDWKITSVTPTGSASTTATAPTKSLRKGCNASGDKGALAWVQRHPVLFAVTATGIAGGATSYFFPAVVNRWVVLPLQRVLPPAIAPPTLSERASTVKHERPYRSLSAGGEYPEVRREAVLVLGADEDTPGAQIALDLERRGFVVVATVSTRAGIDKLERAARGYLKAVLLDPEDPATISAFTRSFSTALSLRYPLYTPGDPFASRGSSQSTAGAAALSLTAVVNCFPLTPSPHHSAYMPVESVDAGELGHAVEHSVGTFVRILRSVMNELRLGAGRPGAPHATILTLFPSKTANISLPFEAMKAATDQALRSLLTSFRRELATARVSAKRPVDIRIVQLDVGHIDFYRSSSTPAPQAEPFEAATPLDSRMSTIYSSAIERKRFTSATSASMCGKRTRAAGKASTSPSRAKLFRSRSQKFLDGVFNLIVYGRQRAGPWGWPSNTLVTRQGRGATSYYLAGAFAPTWIVDTFLSSRDRILSIIQYRFPRVFAITPPPPQSPTTPTAVRRTSATGTTGAAAASTVDPQATPVVAPRPLPVPPPLPSQAGPSATANGVNAFTAFQAHRRANGEDAETLSDEGLSDEGEYIEGEGLGSFVGSEAGWRDLSSDEEDRSRSR